MPTVQLTKKGKLPKRVHAIVNKMLDLMKAERKLYNQGAFPAPTSEDFGVPNAPIVCNTPFCAAGFVVMAKSERLFRELSKQDYNDGSVSWETEAAHIIGIPLDSGVTASYDEVYSLFGSAGSWPEKYAERYRRATTPMARVNVATARWKAWLKAEGQEPEEIFDRHSRMGGA